MAFQSDPTSGRNLERGESIAVVSLRDFILRQMPVGKVLGTGGPGDSQLAVTEERSGFEFQDLLGQSEEDNQKCPSWPSNLHSGL